MPINKRSGQTPANPWQKQDIVGRIKIGKVVPVISNEIINDLLLGGQADLIKGYAEYIEYPLDSGDDLLLMTKFKRINGEIDDFTLKSDYLNYLKNRVYGLAEADGAAEDSLAAAEDEVDQVSFSTFAEHLGYPRFSSPQDDPFLILADLPLPIYLTTCHHDFVEVALLRAGKTPRPEICRWQRGLEGLPSVFETNSQLEPGKPYQPTPQEPLVYHLHGLDERPDSLVLTEDDYLQFLIAMARDKNDQAKDPVPVRVRQAIADSALLLLGYNLSGWAFRSLFWGLIKETVPHTGVFTIQLEPTPVQKKYFEDYLKREASFESYWGDIRQYTRELYQKWNG